MKNRITDYLPFFLRRDSAPETSDDRPGEGQLAAILEPIEQVIAKYPAAAIAAAFLAGAALAWWIKRK